MVRVLVARARAGEALEVGTKTGDAALVVVVVAVVAIDRLEDRGEGEGDGKETAEEEGTVLSVAEEGWVSVVAILEV